MTIDFRNVPVIAVETDSFALAPRDAANRELPKPMATASPQVSYDAQAMDSGSDCIDLVKIDALIPLPGDVKKWVDQTHEDLYQLLGHEFLEDESLSQHMIALNPQVQVFLEERGALLQPLAGFSDDLKGRFTTPRLKSQPLNAFELRPSDTFSRHSTAAFHTTVLLAEIVCKYGQSWTKGLQMYLENAGPSDSRMLMNRHLDMETSYID